MNKEFGIIKIVKEDILRILSERKRKISLDIIKKKKDFIGYHQRRN
jgi:hypothetical protein